MSLTKQMKNKKKRRIKRAGKKLRGLPTAPVPEEERQRLALLYLHTWYEDRENWSFKKKLQYWLLSNMYKKEKISKSDFKMVLQYLEKLKGFHRTNIITDASELVKKYNKEEEDENTVERTADCKTRYKRAKKILKTLT